MTDTYNVIGVDGCRDGWIAAILTADGLTVRRFDDISQIVMPKLTQ